LNFLSIYATSKSIPHKRCLSSFQLGRVKNILALLVGKCCRKTASFASKSVIFSLFSGRVCRQLIAPFIAILQAGLHKGCGFFQAFLLAHGLDTPLSIV
jgi:hypothetical protein